MIIFRIPFSLLRFFIQSVFLALGQIWANKTRSVLTTMGIIIGVASVSAVIAALTGLRAQILDDFATVGTNKIFIHSSQPDTGRHRHTPWRSLRMSPSHIEGMLEHCPSVDRVTRICGERSKIQHGDRVVESASITGIEPDWHKIENRSVTVGRPFTLVDDTSARPVCLVSPVARDKLHLDRDPVGQSIYIGRSRFLIVGVVEPPAEFNIFGSGTPEVEVLIPFRTAWRRANNWMYVMANSRNPEVADDARAEIRFFLRRKLELRPEDPDTFGIEVIEKFLKQFDTIALTITAVAGGIVGVSLLVAGVGIMNIMLVSVSERTREIGLRKAVGAKPRDILLQFLIEAVTLCSIGGLVGLSVGELLTFLMGLIPGAKLEQAYIPIWAILISVGFAAMVGVCFGLFPAVKAARLDPIEALRYE